MNLYFVLLFVNLLVLHKVESAFLNVAPVALNDQLAEEGKNGKLNMTVFYATQCPYSIEFFKHQLPKLFDQTELYKYINFDFVPYIKKAESIKKKWMYTCIHGPEECQYSKLHSCILNEFPINKSANDFKKLVPSLICLMDTKHEVEVIPKCIKKYGFNDKTLMRCLSKSELVGKLMSRNLKKIKNSKPPVSQVPTIQFNGINNIDASNIAEYDIIKGVCSHLKEKPSACNGVAAGDINYNTIMI